MHFLRYLRNKSRCAAIASQIALNYRTRFKSLRGDLETLDGTIHSGFDLNQSLAYINLVYDDYVTYGGLSAEIISGARILEVGPGDNMGVALRFLAGNARQVVCLDKFYSRRNERQQLKIYAALRESLPANERAAYDQAVQLSGTVAFNPDRLQYLYGIGVEQTDAKFSPGSFDLIISRAVLMEVMEIDRAFMAMDTVLAPGGRMVHKIDLSDFAIFPNPPFHPLEFLTVNRPVHGAMTSYTGSPNRRFVDYYRHKMRELGYDFTIYIASMLGIAGELRPHKTRIQKGADFQQTELDLIAKIRRRLQPEFRKISDEDLLVTGILLVARKPGKTI